MFRPQRASTTLPAIEVTGPSLQPSAQGLRRAAGVAVAERGRPISVTCGRLVKLAFGNCRAMGLSMFMRMFAFLLWPPGSFRRCEVPLPARPTEPV